MSRPVLGVNHLKKKSYGVPKMNGSSHKKKNVSSVITMNFFLLLILSLNLRIVKYLYKGLSSLPIHGTLVDIHFRFEIIIIIIQINTFIFI